MNMVMLGVVVPPTRPCMTLVKAKAVHEIADNCPPALCINVFARRQRKG